MIIMAYQKFLFNVSSKNWVEAFCKHYRMFLLMSSTDANFLKRYWNTTVAAVTSFENARCF